VFTVRLFIVRVMVIIVLTVVRIMVPFIEFTSVSRGMCAGVLCIVLMSSANAIPETNAGKKLFF